MYSRISNILRCFYKYFNNLIQQNALIFMAQLNLYERNAKFSHKVGLVCSNNEFNQSKL